MKYAFVEIHICTWGSHFLLTKKFTHIDLRNQLTAVAERADCQR